MPPTVGFTRPRDGSPQHALDDKELLRSRSIRSLYCWASAPDDRVIGGSYRRVVRKTTSLVVQSDDLTALGASDGRGSTVVAVSCLERIPVAEVSVHQLTSPR